MTAYSLSSMTYLEAVPTYVGAVPSVQGRSGVQAPRNGSGAQEIISTLIQDTQCFFGPRRHPRAEPHAQVQGVNVWLLRVLATLREAEGLTQRALTLRAEVDMGGDVISCAFAYS